MVCSKCKLVSYCSKICQVSSWPVHKLDCSKPNQKQLADICLAELTVVPRSIVFNKLGTYYATSEWENVLEMEDEVLGLLGAEKCDRVQLYSDKTRIYGMLGEAYQRTGNISTARKYKQMAKDVVDDENYPQNSACLRDKFTAYDNLAGIYKHIGEYDKALILYEKMVATVERKSDLMSFTLKGIGDCLFAQENFNAAMLSFTKAHQILKKTKNKKRLNESVVAIANTFFATRKYSRGLETIDLKFNSSEGLFGVSVFFAVSMWAHAREIRELHNPKGSPLWGGGVNDAVLHSKQIARSDAILKEAVDNLQCMVDSTDTSQVPLQIFMSDITLWCAYATYDAHQKQKSIEYLQKYLDLEIKISGTSCKFCKQIKACSITMLKCSVCNVTRFCNTFCQKACYAKQTWLNVGVMVSHKHMCPLLMQWKQFRKGNAVVEDCVAMQMGFLEACHPFQNILQRGEFFDEYVY